MGFSQQTYESRKEYRLDDPVDREIIRSFEEELTAFEEREPVTVLHDTIFEKQLSGYDLYLHEKMLFHYSKEYPSGAVVRDNLGLFRDAEMKKRAVDSLRFFRKQREEEEKERLAGTLIGNAKDLLGGTVSVDAQPEKLEKKRKQVKKEIKIYSN